MKGRGGWKTMPWLPLWLVTASTLRGICRWKLTRSENRFSSSHAWMARTHTHTHTPTHTHTRYMHACRLVHRCCTSKTSTDTHWLQIFPPPALSVPFCLIVSLSCLCVLASVVVRLLGGSVLPPGTLCTMSWLACAE